MSETIDYEEVLSRLRAELSQSQEVRKSVELILRSDAEFDGLSVVGGVRAILRRYHEEKDRCRELEQELKKFVARST